MAGYPRQRDLVTPLAGPSPVDARSASRSKTILREQGTNASCKKTPPILECPTLPIGFGELWPAWDGRIQRTTGSNNLNYVFAIFSTRDPC